jgi:hypothetical protein
MKKDLVGWHLWMMHMYSKDSKKLCPKEANLIRSRFLSVVMMRNEFQSTLAQEDQATMDQKDPVA